MLESQKSENMKDQYQNYLILICAGDIMPIFLKTPTQIIAHDNIEKVIKDVIDLDNQGISYKMEVF